MDKTRILWVDDEIDMLKPHIMFLEQKGYDVDTSNNGDEALDKVEETSYDIVFLDENMPGLSGLETLQRLKEIRESMPIVMITKSEEEHIMEDAIGQKISDYLIKPVNPNQILLSLKRNLQSRRLVSEKTTSSYQQEFRKIAMELAEVRTWQDWVDLYKKLVYWELQLEKLEDEGLQQILISQKEEANNLFARFIEGEYGDWIEDAEGAPLLSHRLVKQEIAPALRSGSKVMMVVIDNLRYDQWKVIQPMLEDYFRIESEEAFFSILPTATQFARNALFAGMMPDAISKRFPDKWVDDVDDEGKNLNEDFFLKAQMELLGLKDKRVHYTKVANHQSGKKLADSFGNTRNFDLNVVVYNFVDILSHSKTEMEVIKELADDDKGYRSITESWFKNSPLFDLLRQVSETDDRVMITTDHGTINVTEPSKLVGQRDLSTNLRYKAGKNMSYDKRDVFAMKDPEKFGLPKRNISDEYVFAKSDKFFAYPNNYNHYVKYFKNTYQHGGLSLEEMIIPYVWLKGK
ncbi:T9SS response regulator signal transducer PorX [Phaeocystidibacter luteus]|uniref:Bifunctional response regulator/alkaline phosphatase family protein n=1 Tax=Phaeocystidibacter luteus TaxID=911197 RepID=A0A6N6RIT3_9FLAO|nr:PglZ domain-containing protein [Phaeocystidibacter luteus]KAB2810288.1 bifunctional response regulator/alkaline phosphatase family protein [Phaeocystidibacter luteus]